MNYTLLFYESPESLAARSDPAQRQAFWLAFGHYIQALRDAGVHAGGAGLQLPETATTIVYRDGERLVQDGPYADTKEQLGGFVIINVPDLDTALEWAARCPTAPGRAIEVRPNLAPME
ncbi:MAG: YciI family protein [Bacteroidetes bacterium]|nr:YciI family protein [Bacteroidota bacterium]